MLFISGSSDDVQFPLSALISSFLTLLDSLNCFWELLDSWNCFWETSGLLELRFGVFWMFGLCLDDVLLFVPGVRACFVMCWTSVY